METVFRPGSSGKIPFASAITIALLAGAPAHAAALAETSEQGTLSGNLRALHFSSHNNYFSGIDQETLSYGGKLGYASARWHGFSAGVSAFLQRGIAHASDPARVDGYLGPDLTAIGEAYVQWENRQFKITAGNQQLDLPFASSYDWRMAPQLFQGVAARYGDEANYLSAFRIYRFKSYIDNAFTRNTTYNQKIDAFSSIGATPSDGFWGLGAMRSVTLDALVLKGQAWQMTYLNYARLTYLEVQVSRKEGQIKPFAALQLLSAEGDGKKILGKVHSRVYGLQLGVKQNSITASLGYNHIAPDKDAYLNGALVTPYAHNVSSGPLFAQPFLSSTQDLGAGHAYAVDLNGAADDRLFIGARYSFMDLQPASASASLLQSEYLAYATYRFSGALAGFSISNFLAVQTSPRQKEKFWQNRLTLDYAF